MSAALHLLLGRAHTGKSARIRAELRALQAAGERAILIVPEQYTFETERTLAESLGGLIGVQVLSFERLAERVLALSGQERPFLSAQGHRMLLKRAALARQDELRALGGIVSQPGFADTMLRLIGDLKRSGLSPEDIHLAAEKLAGHPALGDKLYDIAALYRDTEDYLSGRYLTGDDTMTAAIECIPQSFLQDIPIYIDDIDLASQQLYALMAALLRTAKTVTVALRVDRRAVADADVFAPDMRICAQLEELAASLGSPLTMTDCAPEPRQTAPTVAHLERNLFACPLEPYEAPPDGLTLYGASNRVREAEALASAVLAAAHGGLRYREMAVIASDMAAYAPLIERAFSRRGIPLFLDSKRPVTGHVAADALLSAVQTVAGGYRAADLLQLAKTGCAGAAAPDIEELELYLKRKGLRGGALKKPFTGQNVPEGAERARAALMDALLPFGEVFSAETAGQKVRALYDYLNAIGLREQLLEEAEALRQAGRVALMEEHAQVWRVLMELLEQLDHILGDMPMSGKTFAAVLREGLSGSGIGIIPGTADAVLLGDYARTKCRTVRALFIVGVNEGLLPAARTDDSLINDAELLWMQEAGLSVWNSSLQRAAMDRLDIYTAFSKATESVYISYAFTGEAGELAPSPLIETLQSVFPQLRLASDLDSGDGLPLCRAEALAMLAKDLAALHAGEGAAARLPSLLRYCREDKKAAPRAARMLEAASRRGGQEALSPEDARMLYAGSAVMSVSRLETFSRCPFKHFIRYGLGAAEERAYEERALDLGSFYHDALEALIHGVQARQLDWAALNDEAVDALMEELLPPVIAAHNEGIFLSSPRHRATLFLLVNTIRASARAIARQIRAGGFIPLSAECRFGPGEAFPPLPLITADGQEASLMGVIDRIDTADIDDARYYRVVDYKTGGRKLDFGEVLDGLALQLPLYLAAAAKAGNGRAGLYYMTLSAPLPTESADMAAAATEAFRLKGLTLQDPRVVLANDFSLASGKGLLEGVSPDGESFKGDLCTAEQMNVLIERSLDIAREKLQYMRAGRIEARPLEKVCDYCDYRSICRFDTFLPGCRVRRKRRASQADFFGAEGGDGA